MTMIGIDPHKATHTAVAVDDDENVVDEFQLRASAAQADRLRAWADGFDKREWAIESANGLGYLVAQQLVAAGETVFDVPPVLASRVRLMGSGRSQKNDPNDARSIAIAAMRSDRLGLVGPDDHSRVLRLLAKRHRDMARLRNKHCTRLHALLLELEPGGIGSEITVTKANALLDRIVAGDQVTRHRVMIAGELVDDIARLDKALKASKKRITVAVGASGTTLTDIVRGRSDLRGDHHRLHRRCHPVRDQRPFRHLQRNRTDRSLLRSEGEASAQPQGQPQAQPRHPHRRHQPAPLRLRRSRLLRPQDRRGQVVQRRHPGPEATDLRPGLPTPRRRRPTRSHQLKRRWAREDTQERLRSPA